MSLKAGESDAVMSQQNLLSQSTHVQYSTFVMAVFGAAAVRGFCKTLVHV